MRDLRRAAVRLVRRAILTLVADRDPDRRFLYSSMRSSMPAPVRSAAESFNQPAARARLVRSSRAFRPTPADLDIYLDVLAWLTWLERQPLGGRDVAIITARAFGASWWRLAEMHGRSEETLRRWEAGAYAAIAFRFWREIERYAPLLPEAD